MQATPSDQRMKSIKRTVRLEGLSDIMFDRYAGDNQTKLLWNQKIYIPPNTNILSLPTMNVVSFLCSHNTNSAPKRLRDARQYKKIANACLSFVVISGHSDTPGFIPFERDGERITVGDFGDNQAVDEKSGLYLHRSVARLDKGIPNPKERPTLPLPWSLCFTINILQNKEIKEQEIKNLFDEGGVAIGLGTFRGVFGKFFVSEWK